MTSRPFDRKRQVSKIICKLWRNARMHNGTAVTLSPTHLIDEVDKKIKYTHTLIK